MPDYRSALDWCRFFWARGTQSELSLTGIGESLLHPEFPEIVRLARETLPDTFINLSSNGLQMTEEIGSVLARHRVGIYISDHVPERAREASAIAQRHGVYLGLNASARERRNSFDWAGQVDHPVTFPSGRPCPWLGQGWAAVLVDGRITTCCLDAAGSGVVGHVRDIPGSAAVQPFRLCASCHHVVP